MYKKIITICCVCLSCVLNLNAQFEHDYIPFTYSSSGYKMSEASYYKKLSVKYETGDKNIIKKFNGYLYQLHRAYASGSKDKQYIIEPYVKKYLQNIMDTIVAKNKLKEKFEIVCTRYVVPNAFNMGDNKLYVNIGLLEQLQNESQLVFLLCHELSHQLLSHVQQSFIDNEIKAKDKTRKREIRDINKAKYNKLDKTFQFIKNSQYDYAKHSRAQEKAADSMALVLMLPTNYSLQEGKTLMQILDHCDEDSTKIDYNPYLGNSGNEISDTWLKAPKQGITFGKKSEMELDKDSAKTHPDIPIRILMMDTVISLLKDTQKNRQVFVQTKSAFDSLCNSSKFEMIEVFMKRKRYGAVVYYSIKLLNKYPDNKYLYKNIAMGLNELNKSVKKHTVQNYLPIESEDFSEGYNHLLRIIDRTTADEFEALVKNYLTKYYSKMNSYSEIQTIYNELVKK